MTLTSLAPRPPVDPDGLEAAHRVLLARIEAERLSPVRAPRRPVWRWAALAVGVAGATAVAVALPGTGDAPAFAGWTAVPNTSDPATLAARGEECVELQTTALGGAPFDLPEARPVITDQRGSTSLTLLASPDGAVTCMIGPRVATASTVGADGGASVGIVPDDDPTRLYDLSVQGIEPWEAGPPAAGEVSVLTWSQPIHPEPWFSIVGRVGDDVRAVDVHTSEGTVVRASLGGGYYVAWWPGTATGASVVPILDGGEPGEALDLAADIGAYDVTMVP